jgi:hypothetical protein
MYEFGPEGQTFDIPAKVKLEVDVTRLPAGYSIADVVVQRAPVGTSAFEVLPTRILDATHVEADTLHFSVFVPTLDATRATDGGVDGGIDGGACAERCVNPNDGGATCECSRVCGQDTVEIQCSGSSPLGCACVRNGVQVSFVSTNVCPAASDLDRLCGFSVDAGVTDGGIRPDGGVTDGGTDGGIRPDGGVTDGGADGGVADAGTDGGIRPDGGVSDGGTTVDGGVSDGGFPTDGGSADAGNSDAGSFDGGVSDGGTTVDAGTPDGGTDAGTSDAGTRDAGP